LQYFASHPDKLFILITTPPSQDQAVAPEHAAALWDINKWLVYHWLENYQLNNVATFNYYNVLTSSSGNPNTNDLGEEKGNHHHYRNGQVEHVVNLSSDFLAYPSEGPDNYPTPAGHKKATSEFIELLNITYHCWKGSGGRPALMG
jgi:hypothetical protein